ncbi:MAG: 50S ribosomal protein L10 [Chloroflexi bacterium]|nr:MAG: 50S ribosomal protein L10 [Chloroflexota bacterium]TME17643.1 MAG: 50S ribosomal protein L10 [Chloroflexota bacterium]TMF09994.1 MAG: 50S ribosomal protein L10 [Chloroflexota bacterium]TMF17729.1 MAG: 50S ribosomal protein L10 [Chloroflexota bacterium]TMF32594.1 MAG: 50S ribosomal protein L10 [Chloroflexota bacterium]
MGSEGLFDPSCLGIEWAGRIFYLPRARKEQKAEQVELLTEKLKKAKVAVLTDYRGLTVSQIQDLRGKLRTGDVEYRVVKNTLARRAAEAAGAPALQSELEGPVAIAFGYDDLSAPAKLINEWVRQTRLKLDVKGGLVEGRVFSPDQVKQLADLPSRETLIAQLMGTLQSPVGQLVAIMQTPHQQLLGALNAYKNKLEAA